MPTFEGPLGQSIEVRDLRFSVSGESFLPGEEMPLPKTEVTGVWRGTVVGWDVRPDKQGGFYAVAKVKLTSADLEVVPPPPGLFEDLDRPAAAGEWEPRPNAE